MKTSPVLIYLLFVICVLMIGLGSIVEGCQVHDTGDAFPCQNLRFMAIRKGRTAYIYCNGVRENCSSTENCTFSWYIGNPDGSRISYIRQDADPHMQIRNSYYMSTLTLNKVQKKHSGIYFCESNKRQAQCGTEIMVVAGCTGKPGSAFSRNIMKDSLILVETILVLLFTLIPAMLLMEMNKKRSVKLEEHIYEGLDVYQTATYEDIHTVRNLSTKRMIAEHPCME
ncbi:B-cell antigen receptor complex-associated protein beta chain-like isoform X2 [Xenopus laevis]|uniref:B-cell antigen receptor complex-associated protein beta chain-like isoform X2 n=1 Tax=Xenopus laevis TaxID=8355 RepID=A0A8J1LSP7_XENLA|nr:B-cell antigen receptor complex-associated protein beta chain-like isoform X2 [Xenopus laevis]